MMGTAVILYILLGCQLTLAFIQPSSTYVPTSSVVDLSSHRLVTFTQRRQRHLVYQSDNDDAIDQSTPSRQTALGTNTIEALKAQAQRAKLEAERLEMELALEKIAKLEQLLLLKEEKKNEDIVEQIQTLTKQVDPSLLQELDSSSKATKPKRVETNLYKKPFPPTKQSLQSTQPTLSEQDLQAACEYYMTLSQPMKQAMARAVNLDFERTSPAVIVLALYESMREDGTVVISDSEGSKTLRELYLASLRTSPPKSITVSSTVEASMEEKKDSFDNISNEIQNEFEEAMSMSNLVESILPRVTRKEEPGFQPTLQDVSFLTTTKDVLNKDTFLASEPPETIPGGFIIRGTIADKLKEDGDELIKLLDERIQQVQPQFLEKFQICVIFDPTPKFMESADSISGDPVLLITNKDLRPSSNMFLSAGLTSISLFSTLVFSISTFGSNKVVYDKLAEANSIIQTGGDYDISWFNELVFPLLASLAITQISHEVAHWFVSRKDGFRVSAPTILPLMSLPYLTFQTRLKTSPKNLSTLFDFGFAGPAVGMIVSMCFLLIGLQLTLNMDAEAVKYAPAVPVYFLKLSSLGGGIVDYVLGGGSDGIILSQDPITPVTLHPFAIGGLASLMVNALDTIPIGATDGGRMSQSLLGRAEQVTFSGILYGGLLLYVILTGHRDLFLAYLLIGSFAQKDLEIPCRNELNKAGLSQATLALVIWCVAFLALAPM